MKPLAKAGLALLALLALALLIGLFAGVFHDKVDTDVAPRFVRIAGETANVQSGRTDVMEAVAGTVQATSDTIIASRILASILKVNVRAGDVVAENDVLLELDDRSLREVRAQRAQDVAAAQAVRDDLARTLTRIRSLRQQGSVSQAELDRAVTNLRQADATLQRVREAEAEAATAVSYAAVRAPMAGTVVDRLVEPGDTASPGQPLLKLYNPGQMRIEATVRESLIDAVRVGAEVAARVDAEDLEVTAVIEEVVPSADPSSRTFLLKARLREENTLFPGMFARLYLPAGTRGTLSIPASAVVTAGQLQFVYVRGADTDARRFVRLGRMLGDRVEVRSGLAADEVVVIPENAVAEPALPASH